jgi:uncharacterized protein
MKSKVYFIPVDNAQDVAGVNQKLAKLLAVSHFFDFIEKDTSVALKLHFGEEGNTGFISPYHLRPICDGIIDKGATPLLSDANTLYRGKRVNSAEHHALACEHGFTKSSTGAAIIIPDDSDKSQTAEVEINQSYIKKAKVCRFYLDADAMVAVSHFKGHGLTGFGGALKNVGMGCATREGKLAQHCDVAPTVTAANCIGCGDCEKVCPTGALEVIDEKITLDKRKCIGCASCMAACRTFALFVDFTAGDKTQMKMVEYSLAVLKDKKGKTAFINFALKISKECDCWGGENPRIAPDVGILFSTDPVSIDKASFDLINQASGKDIFKEQHPDQDGLKQLSYAQELGMGNLEYELVTVT